MGLRPVFFALYSKNLQATHTFLNFLLRIPLRNRFEELISEGLFWKISKIKIWGLKFWTEVKFWGLTKLILIWFKGRYVYIKPGIANSIFNMGYGSVKSPVDQRVKINLLIKMFFKSRIIRTYLFLNLSAKTP